MPSEANGTVAQSLTILRAAVFSTSVNGYVLSRDRYFELLEILESDENPDSPEKESTRTRKKPKR